LRTYGAVDPDFLVLVLNARPFRTVLDATATGLTAKGIKAPKLKRLPVPIPPLAEQHRIVAKVDALMAVCNQLEQNLAAEQTQRARLLDALLHDAFEHPLPARELEFLTT
jgi:type I restriction enzyme, S subunit